MSWGGGGGGGGGGVGDLFTLLECTSKGVKPGQWHPE